MAKRLTQNITSLYIEAANSLRPKTARKRIVAYVESYDDVSFWSHLLSEYNSEKHYFTKLDRAELAGNSDHYPFAQRNVPCIFFMNEGGDAFKYYHTIYDTWKNAIFDNYEPTVKLIMDFIEKY